MKPCMATSFPLYDLIVSVTPESARIESTSRAKVRRRISSEPAKATEGATGARRQAASHARSCRVMRVKLGQRRKVFRDLRAIREHSRQQSRQGTQENDAGQDSGVEHVEEGMTRNPTTRPEQGPGQVGDGVSADDPARPPAVA